MADANTIWQNLAKRSRSWPDWVRINQGLAQLGLVCSRLAARFGPPRPSCGPKRPMLAEIWPIPGAQGNCSTLVGQLLDTGSETVGRVRSSPGSPGFTTRGSWRANVWELSSKSTLSAISGLSGNADIICSLPPPLSPEEQSIRVATRYARGRCHQRNRHSCGCHVLRRRTLVFRVPSSPACRGPRSDRRAASCTAIDAGVDAVFGSSPRVGAWAKGAALPPSLWTASS